VFNKYTIDGQVLTNYKGKTPTLHKDQEGYHTVGLTLDNGKRRYFRLCRIVASTYHGKPPTLGHTVDHIKSEEKTNDDPSNLRWANWSDQNKNRKLGVFKTGVVIVKDGEERTPKDWVKHLENDTTPRGTKYTESIIKKYANLGIHGFSHKKYKDLKGEVWRPVVNSGTSQVIRWEISNMNRVKCVKSANEKVFEGSALSRIQGYPFINIRGARRLCHLIAFEAFFPEEYAKMVAENNSLPSRDQKLILHKEDDRKDFRPHMLRVGTRRDNAKDARANGKYMGTKSDCRGCVSYINGVLEHKFQSMKEAARYLKANGYEKASGGCISYALTKYENNVVSECYGRTWAPTRGDNAKDARANGKYMGTKSDCRGCVSYINGVLEHKFQSMKEAARYLKANGYEKANGGCISSALTKYENNVVVVRYDRTWAPA
jgi:hypothetical protein